MVHRKKDLNGGRLGMFIIKNNKLYIDVSSVY